MIEYYNGTTFDENFQLNKQKVKQQSYEMKLTEIAPTSKQCYLNKSK